MSQLEHRYVILAALEFDETGVLALQEAVRFAEGHSSAEVHAVHIYGAGLDAESDGTDMTVQMQRASAPEKLRTYVARACSETRCLVTGHIRAGKPVEGILQAAADLNADMIVLGSHRRTGIGRLMLRPTVERVLHEAHCPVLIAVPKSYELQIAANAIEPPCPDCLAKRSGTHDPNAWCERHSRARLRPHVYSPSDLAPRASVMGS